MMDLTSILNYEEFIHDFLQQWFLIEAPLGREIFQNNNRVWVNNFNDFKSYILECKKSAAPCWLSVQPYKARDQPAMVEKLYFDFDSSNLPLAWHEAMEFYNTVKEFYNVEPLVCFSGNKGYNVYVWLQKPFEGPNVETLKTFYRTAQNILLKGQKFKTLDPQPLGDIKRFSRVPYSIHQKTWNPCVPINVNHNPILIAELNAYREHGLNNGFVNLCLKQLERKLQIKRLKVFKENNGIRPCIHAALNQPLEHKAGHLMRLAIATEFLNKGYTVDDIVPFFKNQPDFTFERSRYFVQDAKNRGYKPFKCRTIRELGFCILECPKREPPYTPHMPRMWKRS